MILVKWMALTDGEGLLYIDRHFAEEVVQAIRENKKIVRFDMPSRKSKRNINP